MPELAFESVTFEEALTFAINRKAVLPDEYFGQRQGIARAESFSVTGLSRLAQINQIKDSLAAALEEGMTFQSWKETAVVDDLLSKLPEYRIRETFGTNVQMSYARGKCLSQAKTADRKPWLLYSAVGDSRTRPGHLAMHKTLLPRDDPFWIDNRPPNGHLCRCTPIALTDKQARARGGATQPSIDSISGEPGRADEGWDFDICRDSRSGSRVLTREALKNESVMVTNAMGNVKAESNRQDPSEWSRS